MKCQDLVNIRDESKRINCREKIENALKNRDEKNTEKSYICN